MMDTQHSCQRRSDSPCSPRSFLTLITFLASIASSRSYSVLVRDQNKEAGNVLSYPTAADAKLTNIANNLTHQTITGFQSNGLARGLSYQNTEETSKPATGAAERLRHAVLVHSQGRLFQEGMPKRHTGGLGSPESVDAGSGLARGKRSPGNPLSWRRPGQYRLGWIATLAQSRRTVPTFGTRLARTKESRRPSLGRSHYGVRVTGRARGGHRRAGSRNHRKKPAGRDEVDRRVPVRSMPRHNKKRHHCKRNKSCKRHRKNKTRAFHSKSKRMRVMPGSHLVRHVLLGSHPIQN